jgi:hypothetical protein
MKNIHVIPTDKPSRFVFIGGTSNSYHLLNYNDNDNYKSYNIYITSNEEIKDERCWVINTMNKIESVPHSKWGKLIIMTTDQDLIKDGVQTIDDKFLEWFVKNPSCESVKFKDIKDTDGKVVSYRFISALIPREETLSFEEFRKIASKELLEKFDTDCLEYSEDGDFDNYFYANCKYWESKLKEEPKQDAIEYSLNAFKVPKEYFGKQEIKIQCKDCSTSLEDCTCIEDTIEMKQETLEESNQTTAIRFLEWYRRRGIIYQFHSYHIPMDDRKYLNALQLFEIFKKELYE